MDLSQKKCVPCEIGTPPLSIEEANKLLENTPYWHISDDKLQKEFKFADFKEAMNFVNKVADIAEEEGHHPDIFIFYNKVTLTLFTHAARGLTENDFILASKVDKLG